MNSEQMEIDADSSNNNNNVLGECQSKLSLLVPSVSSEHCRDQFLQTLYELRCGNVLCDAVIKLCDGGVFPIHRIILSACSPYFRTLFTTTLHSQRRTEFNLPGVDSDIMNQLLNYAYLRYVKLTHENVCKLFIAAEYLSIFGILELCCKFVRMNLTPENCIGVMKFAKEYVCIDLEIDVHNYVIRHIPEISARNKDILSLSLEELLTIISAYNLNVKSEEVVWELIVKWIDVDPDSRKKHIVELMKNVRLGLLHTQYFLERVRGHPYVTGNEECRPIIIETLKFLYDLEMITLKDVDFMTPEIARPRVPHEILFTIGGWCGGSATNFIESYDTRADRWIKVAEVDPGPLRAYHDTAVIGFDIYVIGGFNGVECFNSCRKFNAVTKEWSEIAPMYCKRAYVSAVVLDNIIYALGGSNGHYRQKSAEKYDYKRNQWTPIAKMNCRRSDASATTYKNKIYITGGFDGMESLNSVEVYDPETNQWTLIARMRSYRSGCSCIAYNDHIYVIGGYNGTSRLFTGEKYNPVTRTWSSIPDMYTPRSNYAIAVIDDMIFVMGGYNGTTTVCHVECYCAKNNEWYEATDMNLDRSGPSACVIMGLPNVADYIHKHRERLMEEKRQKLLQLGRQRVQMQSRYIQESVPTGQHRLFPYLQQ